MRGHTGKILAIFGGVAAIMLLSVLVVYWMGLRVTWANASLYQSRLIIEGLEDTLSALTVAESGQRGFLLTGDEKYLEFYDAASGRIRRSLSQMERWSRSGDISPDLAAAAARLTQAKLEELQQTIQLRRNKGAEAALAVERSGTGKHLMDDLRTQIAAMETQEQQEFDLLYQQREFKSLLRTLVTVAMGLVTLGFLGWAFRRIQQEMADTERQRQLLAVTLASIGDGVIVTDPRRRVTFLNAEAERLTGWKSREVEGRLVTEIFRIVNEDTRQVVESPVDKVLRLGTVVGLANHTILIAKDGRETPIDDSGAPIRQADGTVEGVVLVFRDFSEHKRAAAALQEVANQRRLALEAAELGAWDYRFDTGEVFWDDRCRDIFGVPSGNQIDYDAAIGVIHPDDRTATDAAVQEALAGVQGGAYHREFRVQWPDGSVHWVASHGRVHFEGEGPNRRAVRFIGVNMDITRRKGMEEVLAQRQALLDAVCGGTDDAIFVKDRECRLRLANPATLRAIGKPSEETLGHRDDEFYEDPALGAAILENDRRIMETGRAEVVEESIPTPQGVRTFLSTKAPWRDGKGEVIGLIGVARDITERKGREEKLHTLNRTLQALSNSSQAMLRARDEAAYLQDICQIIVADCGHAMVWIGYAQEDEAKTVRPVAQAGFETGYLQTLQVTWADTERGRGPTGMAVRTGRPSICRNMLTDPRFAPWREQARQRGYASSIGVPLLAGGRAFGALTIYAEEPDAFSDDEVSLLTELANDLAHGISAIRLRQAHAKAEEALRQSEERYRALFNEMTEGFALHEIICDDQGVPCDYRFLDINPAFERLTGLKREEVVGKTTTEVLPNDDPSWIRIYGAVALTGQATHFENYSPVLTRHYEVFAYCPAPRQFAVLFTDITQRKVAADLLRQANTELERRVVERTGQLAAVNADLREQMTAYERLEAEVAKLVEAERVALGMELHDNLCQQLAATGMLTSALRKRLEDQHSPLADTAERIVQTLSQAGADARRMAGGLLPVQVEASGLMMALAALAQQTQEMQDVACVFECAAPVLVENNTTATYLFRIAQEAMHNALKHGQARHIVVTLTKHAAVTLTVRDDGVGIPPEGQRPVGSGLRIMHYRARVIGAELSVARVDGTGTLVRCILRQGAERS